MLSALKEKGVDFDAVNYYIDPIPKAKIKELIGKMGISAKALLRKKEPIYKELELDRQELSDSKLIELMAKHPDLIQRPILEKGKKAILARPAQRVEEIL